MTDHTMLILVSIVFTLCFWCAIICTFLWVRYEDKKLYPEKYLNWIK